MNSPLQNTINLLTQKNELTIGYFGGSITCGGSARHIIENGQKVPEKSGSIMDSYVNRTSSWFKEMYPNAKIETVNAGVSGTHSQLGLYRLEGTLMNNDGHNLPDLVFIEFTSNDWVYCEHTAEIVKAEVESLVINVRKINPFADIIILATNTLDMQNCDKKQVHKEVADQYGLPFIDVGIALQRKKNTDPESAPTEKADNNTLKYTADNLHPSALGYAVYMEEIKRILAPIIENTAEGEMLDHTKSAPAPLSAELFSPKLIPTKEMMLPESAEVVETPLTVPLHGILIEDTYNYPVANDYVVLEPQKTITAKFSGSILGILVAMQRKVDLTLSYSIDGGEWQEFGINDSRLSFERYPHTQAFFLKGGLSDEEHTVILKNEASDIAKIGALLAQI